MSLEIIAGRREAVGLFLLDRIKDIHVLPGGYEAVGVARDGRLVGGVLYTNYVKCEGGADCQLWAAGERGWISRRIIKALVGYPFLQLGCHRITAIAARKNKASRRLIEGLGFKLEGLARNGMRPGVDAVLYGLQKRDFLERWLHGGVL